MGAPVGSWGTRLFFWPCDWHAHYPGRECLIHFLCNPSGSHTTSIPHSQGYLWQWTINECHPLFPTIKISLGLQAFSIAPPAFATSPASCLKPVWGSPLQGVEQNKSHLGSCSQGALQLINTRDSNYAEETTQRTKVIHRQLTKPFFWVTSSLSKEDNSEGARAGWEGRLLSPNKLELPSLFLQFSALNAHLGTDMLQGKHPWVEFFHGFSSFWGITTLTKWNKKALCLRCPLSAPHRHTQQSYYPNHKRQQISPV